MWFEILYLPLRLTETHNSGRNSALCGVCVTEDNILLRCASKTQAPEASPTLLGPSSSTRIGAAAVGGHQASRATLRASGPAFCQLTDAAMFRAVPSAIFFSPRLFLLNGRSRRERPFGMSARRRNVATNRWTGCQLGSEVSRRGKKWKWRRLQFFQDSELFELGHTGQKFCFLCKKSFSFKCNIENLRVDLTKKQEL